MKYLYLSLLFFLWPLSASASISLIQSTSTPQTNSGDVGNYTSKAVTFGSNTTIGNTIIVGVYVGNTGQTISVSDTAGDSFSNAARTTQVTDGHQTAIFYATAKGGADTITASWTSGSGYNSVHAYEFSGLSSSPFDVVSTSTGSGTVQDSGSATTNQASELIFGFVGESGAGSAATMGSTFTGGISTTYGNLTNSISEYKTVSSVASYNATSSTSGSENWDASMATFKENTTVSATTIPFIVHLGKVFKVFKGFVFKIL